MQSEKCIILVRTVRLDFFRNLGPQLPRAPQSSSELPRAPPELSQSSPRALPELSQGSPRALPRSSQALESIGDVDGDGDGDSDVVMPLRFQDAFTKQLYQMSAY